MRNIRGRRTYLWAVFLLVSGLGFGLFYSNFFSGWMETPLRPAPPVIDQALQKPSFQMTPIETLRFQDDASLARWERKVFKGETQYAIRGDAGDRYLNALSENASCGLFMKTRHEAVPGLYLRWKWRVREFPKKKIPTRLSSREEDDFAARLYVIFEASNLFRSDIIEYIWDENIAAGEAADSAYSDRIKLLVVRSGKSPEGGAWQEETRNPLDDYKKLFGRMPKYPMGIVALMCDSDNTGTRASADFGDIVFGMGKDQLSAGEGEI